VVKVARLGGYLVMGRGFARLADIALGAALVRASLGCG
jgi:hypothetical protein